MCSTPASWVRRRLGVGVACLLLAGGCTMGETDSDPPVGAEEAEPGPQDDEVGEAPVVPALHPSIDAFDETVVTVSTGDGDVRVDAKVAATDDERRRGLMEVEDLPDGVGMLFLFEEERSGGFWMWNTLVPLDIAFVDADGRIDTILAMDPCEETSPTDCEVYTPPRPYLTALEVPQGWFAANGIEPGATLRWSDPVPAAPRTAT
jgi:uncharacterized membrane protein (UPF0127 family)